MVEFTVLTNSTPQDRGVKDAQISRDHAEGNGHGTVVSCGLTSVQRGLAVAERWRKCLLSRIFGWKILSVWSCKHYHDVLHQPMTHSLFTAIKHLQLVNLPRFT